MYRARFYWKLIATISAFVLSGCSAVPHNDVMLFGTDTKLAVDVSTTPENASIPQLTVGYKRREFVWMPLVVNGIDSALFPEAASFQMSEDAKLKFDSGKTISDETNGYYSAPPKSVLTIAGEEVTFHRTILLKAPGNSKFQTNADNSVNIPKGTWVKCFECEELGGLPVSYTISEAKYKGVGPGKAQNLSDENDTYSVLASFGSNIKGGNIKGEAGVGIAQFFATGIAARRLAEQGGSNLVTLKNVNQEVVAAKQETIDELKKSVGEARHQADILAGEQKVTIEEAKVELIMVKLVKNGALDTALLKTSLSGASNINTNSKNRLENYQKADDLKQDMLYTFPDVIDPLFSYFYPEKT